MINFSDAFYDAINIIFNLDTEFLEIIIISLQVSLSAMFFAVILTLPIASFLSVSNFIGKDIIIVIINALMALPPVVVGLSLYLILSSQGFLGQYQLLYTVSAMILAQTIIILPIMISLSKESIDYYYDEYKEYLFSVNCSNSNIFYTLLWEARHKLTINILAGLGRALSEVGAIIIVGGNIAHLTRTMTTGIVLETSRGDLPMALSLGITLIAISLLINIVLYFTKIHEE
tara:strand:- start:997 stop:1689 length:693 start_codon:yes stop_codon:yes gene_type:complete